VTDSESGEHEADAIAQRPSVHCSLNSCTIFSQALADGYDMNLPEPTAFDWKVVRGKMYHGNIKKNTNHLLPSS